MSLAHLGLVVVVLVATVTERTEVPAFPEGGAAQAQGQVGGGGVFRQAHLQGPGLLAHLLPAHHAGAATAAAARAGHTLLWQDTTTQA